MEYGRVPWSGPRILFFLPSYFTAAHPASRTSVAPRFCLRSVSLRSNKTGTPLAAAGGRFALLDPGFVRTSPVDVIKKETINMTTLDQINELRAELRSCYFTKTERAMAEAELAALVAQAQAEDEQFASDIALYLADLE